VNRFAPGRMFKSRGRPYQIVGPKDHWCQNGRYVEMIRYQSVCAEPGCKRTFMALTTKTRIRKGQLNKRCELHHAPGVPIPVTKAKKVKKVRKKRRKIRSKKPTAAASLAARRERAVQRALVAMQRVQRPSYLD